MTVTLDLLEPDGTSVISGITGAVSRRWNERERSSGDGSFVIKADSPHLPTLLSKPDRVIRVSEDGTPRFSWLVRSIQRSLAGPNLEHGGSVTVSGPGTRELLAAGKIMSYGGFSLGPQYRERTLGVPDPGYDSSALPAATSLGAWRDQPLGPDRPTSYPDPDAEHISVSAEAVPEAKTYYLISPEFTVDEDGIYGLVVAADDEYDAWVVGTMLGGTLGEFQWKNYQLYRFFLAAATPLRIVIKVRNLARLSTSTNFTWGLASLVPLAGDGSPEAANTLYHIDTTGTIGTFRVSVNGVWTTDLAVGISNANLQTAVEALSTVGAGNVLVTGSGLPGRNHVVHIYNEADFGVFQIGVDGQFTADIAWDSTTAHIKTVLEALPNVGAVTVTGSGNPGDPWEITVTDPAQTSFSFTTNDTLSQGGSPVNSSVSTVWSGTAPDPYALEFVGSLSALDVTMDGNGAGITDGVLTVSKVLVGSASEAIIHTDASWKVLDVGVGGAGMTWGDIFLTTLAEAQARGATKLDDVTAGFTAAADSGTVAWGVLYELTIPVEEYSLLDLVRQGEADGLDIRMDGMQLDAWADRGTDRSGTVTLTKPRPNSRWGWDGSGMVNVVRSFDVNGDLIETEDAASTAIHGRYEDFYLLDAASQSLVEQRHGQALEDGSTPYDDSVQIINEGPLPYDDFEWGDLVTAQAMDASPATYRVSGYECTVRDDDDVVYYAVELVEQ